MYANFKKELDRLKKICSKDAAENYLMMVLLMGGLAEGLRTS